MNKEVRKKTMAAKEEWIEEQCKNMEKGMMSGNSKEAYNILKALTKAQQHKSAVIEDSSGNILTESTAVLNQLHPLAYSTVTRPPYKRRPPYKKLKAYLC